MKYRYNHVACGGTFDLLHKGHTALLGRAFEIGKQVSIGITTDRFCKELGKTPYEPQRIRRQNLIAYLKSNRIEKRSKVIWLNDIYGTGARDKTLQAIVVSGETKNGANLINKKRVKNKLKKLAVVVCPQQKAQDGKKISTGRIKNGEIAKDGTSYTSLLLRIASRRFNDQIRIRLKKPFGKIFNAPWGLQFTQPLIAVGDVSVQTLVKNGIVPDVSIIDFLVNRKRTFANLAQLGFVQSNPDYAVANPPGQISKKLILTVAKALKSRSNQVILVKGEEDLATIPAILLSPLGTTVCYGQPEKGIVGVKVNENVKERLVRLILR